MPQGRKGSVRGSSHITEVQGVAPQGVALQNEAAKVFSFWNKKISHG